MFDVTVDITGLRNLRGNESDPDEPYLMVSWMVLDASTLKISTSDPQSPIDATGITLHWTHRGRGNVHPAEVNEGITADVPASVGRVTARLKPIVLQNPAAVIPGMVVVFLGLYEEDANTNDLIKSIQDKATPMIEQAVRGFLEGLRYTDIAFPDDADHSITLGHPQYRATLIKRLRNDIDATLRPTIRSKLKALAKSEGLSEEPFGSIIDHDDDLGDTLWVVPSDELPLIGFAGTGSLPEREIAKYTGDHSNYHVTGGYSWKGTPRGRLDIVHIDRGEEQIGRPVVRTLETDEGSCGHLGDKISIRRMGVLEEFEIHVPAAVDEFKYDLVVNGVAVTSSGFPAGTKRGVFVQPGPSTWTDLEVGTDVWPTRVVSTNSEPACGWHIDDAESTASGGFVLRVHRLAADELDLRPSMTLPIQLVAHSGSETTVVESTFVQFRSMRLDNPVLECLWGQWSMNYVVIEDFDVLERPPWMDPPFHDVINPGVDSVGWVYQLRDIDHRDQVLVSLAQRIVEPRHVELARSNLSDIGLTADDIDRVMLAARLSTRRVP